MGEEKASLRVELGSEGREGGRERFSYKDTLRSNMYCTEYTMPLFSTFFGQ